MSFHEYYEEMLVSDLSDMMTEDLENWCMRYSLSSSSYINPKNIESVHVDEKGVYVGADTKVWLCSEGDLLKYINDRI